MGHASSLVPLAMGGYVKDNVPVPAKPWMRHLHQYDGKNLSMSASAGDASAKYRVNTL